MDKKLFDLAEEYDSQLQKGLDLSGETAEYFSRGRVADLRGRVPPSATPSRILDFGCGIGRTVQHLSEAFPNAHVVGVDTAAAAISHARTHYGAASREFHLLDALPDLGPFDVCYVNGVFHHIQPDDRRAALLNIRNALRPGGRLALFENNPWNPGTRMVMRRIPFDRGALPLSSLEARRLVLSAGFELEQAIRFLFYFPRPLSALRSFEPWLVRLPLGAQYHVPGRRAH